MSSHLMSLHELAENLSNPNVKILDCRFVLGQPHAGREAYLQDHIPGAFYCDLEQDLSAKVEAHGGRHPLPNLDELAAKLGGIGIDAQTTVVAYDDQGGAMAARLWWLLQYLGHDKTVVLESSYTHWKHAGHPTTSELPHATPKTFTPSIQHTHVYHIDEVKKRLGQPGVTLIDAREERRYLGLEEPIDPVAGHIPSAINHFWKDSLTEEGSWKQAEQQRARFEDLNPDDEIIVYCGSGVTATPNILALREAGFQNVKLYAGSWSDWCSYPENPIGTKQGE
ncbi:sulfurtransferase [Tumebacillus permanentifrigoris]|uniref:Thiosulfate/3-mercaptopyruvate sulfurtransferase n=1 Tax=Tumebacillus permanentifrigoris TaxID=378543 RepID=A0A316DFR7_9BACL|nr:sulfurtransferase [Tumebacillus permanentifrigoris]PWK16392.1 thiosulfate/3-mercaptopyruvate sulfurtransferase [Tumebacillus permanentifrigoris]